MATEYSAIPADDFANRQDFLKEHAEPLHPTMPLDLLIWDAMLAERDNKDLKPPGPETLMIPLERTAAVTARTWGIVSWLDRLSKMFGFSLPPAFQNLGVVALMHAKNRPAQFIDDYRIKNEQQKIKEEQEAFLASLKELHALLKRGDTATASVTSPDDTELKVLEANMLKRVAYLLLATPPKNLRKLFNRIEIDMFTSDSKHYHPLEDVLMLLLRHPEGDREHEEAIILALTSVHGFLRQGIATVPPETVTTLKDIGLLSHNFRTWRYDTKDNNQGDSLFSLYGFTPIKPKATDLKYGQGFSLSSEADSKPPIPKDTLLEFRRGYLLVSNENGTLLISELLASFWTRLVSSHCLL